MGRPVIFRQMRIGYQRKTFIIYKFRTMEDGKFTFPGRLLRATGFDELPQLINILKNDMSFVGPRPLTMNDIDRLGWGSDHYNFRWQVKPGITGLAQLSHRCHPKITMFYDRYYAKNKSFCLDAKIIAWSIVVLFLGKKAVKKLIKKKSGNNNT
jgi:lipopolysaccharide/colanic/teichoic acid biosynthesis glycosyltransferase